MVSHTCALWCVFLVGVTGGNEGSIAQDPVKTVLGARELVEEVLTGIGNSRLQFKLTMIY